MKRKYLLILTACISSILAILWGLYASSSLSKEVYRGQFSRAFRLEPPLSDANILDLKYEHYYIAGYTNSHIFLGNYNAPLHILKTNLALTDTVHIKIKLVGFDGLKIKEPGMFRVHIDSPFFFVTHGVMAEILRGRTEKWTARRFMPDSAYYFVEDVPISRSSFIVRSYSPSKGGYQLAKKNAMDSPYFQFKYGILEKQLDGLFCVEGMLHFCKDLKKVVYLYTYRNQYTIMDTSLNIIQRCNTIDPFSKALVKTVRIESKNTTMIASPPMRVNEKSSVSGSYLYVQSNILSKNEDFNEFKNKSVIDVYDLSEGKYKYSFYLGSYLSNKISDFEVINGRVACIYKSKLLLLNGYDKVPN